jgi:hypothetical protein
MLLHLITAIGIVLYVQLRRIARYRATVQASDHARQIERNLLAAQCFQLLRDADALDS